jgi:hypothetical protein
MHNPAKIANRKFKVRTDDTFSCVLRCDATTDGGALWKWLWREIVCWRQPREGSACAEMPALCQHDRLGTGNGAVEDEDGKLRRSGGGGGGGYGWRNHQGQHRIRTFLSVGTQPASWQTTSMCPKQPELQLAIPTKHSTGLEQHLLDALDSTIPQRNTRCKGFNRPGLSFAGPLPLHNIYVPTQGLWFHRSAILSAGKRSKRTREAWGNRRHLVGLCCALP